MIRSMTGYGRGQAVLDGLSVTVEIKSVNHRFFEYSCRLPRVYGFIDDKLKNYLQQRISRGKVDVFVQIDALESAGSEVLVNDGLAENYLSVLRDMAQKYGLREDISVTTLSRYPDVLTVHQVAVDEDTVWNAVRKVTDIALEQFVAMRER